MAVGLLGVKCGMSRLFLQSGKSVAVTVIRATDNRIVRISSPDAKNRVRVQVAWGELSRKKAKSRPHAGQFSASGAPAGQVLREFRLSAERADEAASLEAGTALGVAQFSSGDFVDVSGISRGKGFMGTVRRWNFQTQDNSHGNSLAHRAPGSIGQCQTPGKVWKGKKMAGHMGAERVTAQNLQVAMVDEANALLYVTGAVPGAPGGQVELRPAVRRRKSGAPLVSDEDQPLALQQLAAAAAEAAEPEAAEEAAETEEAEAAESEAAEEAAETKVAEAAESEPAAEAEAAEEAEK